MGLPEAEDSLASGHGGCGASIDRREPPMPTLVHVQPRLPSFGQLAPDAAARWIVAYCATARVLQTKTSPRLTAPK